MSNTPVFPQDSKNHLPVLASLPSVATPIHTLIDSGATKSFIDEAFVRLHSIKTSDLKLARLLFLFNGSPSTNGHIKKVVVADLDIVGLGKVPVRLLVTPLPNTFPVVLGFDFLKKANPITDWERGTI